MKYFKIFEQYIQPVYHSSNIIFDHFSEEYMSNDNGDLYGNGFYFSNNLEYTKQFGKITYVCKIDLNSPIDLTLNRTKVSELLLKISSDIQDESIQHCINSSSFTTAFRIIRKYKSMKDLISMGYDGVIGFCEKGGKEYIVYSKTNIQIVEVINIPH